MSDTFIELFAGGGGSSSGVLAAFAEQGVTPYGVFLDYDAVAMKVHADNHPGHEFHVRDLFTMQPSEIMLPEGSELDLMWSSPSCCHFSRARADAPVTTEGRAHGDATLNWIKHFMPRALIVEQVREWETWGPLIGEPGSERPDPKRRGEYFQQWLQALDELGYDVEHRVLCSADYGDATIRRRLFVLACRRDSGLTIQWPEPTTPQHRWKTAADVLDLSDMGNPIFERKKGLAVKTLRRVARGILRYTTGERQDLRYLVILHGTSNCQLLDKPLQTALAGGGHQMVVTIPFLVNMSHGQDSGSISGLTEPIKTVTTKSSWGTVICPLDTFQRGTGMFKIETAPESLARDFALILQEELLATKRTGVGPIGMTRNHLGQWRPALHVDDGIWVLNPHLRMVRSRELAEAQGFPTDYVWNCTDTQKTKIIGNSVSGGVAKALAGSFLKQRASQP